MATQRNHKRRKEERFSKKVVRFLLFLVVIFTAGMIAIYVLTGGIPDTLVTAFFAFVGGEAGALGLIKYSDNKFDKEETDNEAD